MIKNEYSLNVDIKRQHTAQIPTFVQYDEAVINFKVFDDGKPFEFDEGSVAKLYHKRLDGVITEGDIEFIEEDYGYSLKYTYQGNEMYIAGYVLATLVIYSGIHKVSIQPFKVHFIEAIQDDAVTPSNPEYGALQNLIVQVEEVIEEARDVVDEFESIKEEVFSNLNSWEHVGSHNISEEYIKNNMVRFNGSTYIALQDNVGQAPTENLSDDYWRLVARKGEDGEGLVVLHKEAFDSKAGDKSFLLSEEYDQFQNRVRVILDNETELFSPEGFIESSSDSITLIDELDKDTEVTIIYFGNAPAIKNDLQQQIDGITNMLENFDIFDISAGYQELFDNIGTSNQLISDLEGEIDLATQERQLTEQERLSTEQVRINTEQERLATEQERLNTKDEREATELVRQEVENLKGETKQAKDNAIDVTNEALEMIESNIHLGDYNSSTQYKKGNEIRVSGSSFVALKDTIGNPPPSISDKVNEWWELRAMRGLDGEGSVVTVNGISPDANGNVELGDIDGGTW